MNKYSVQNEMYKKKCEDLYKEGNFCALRYEKQMDYLFAKLQKDFENKSLNVLDACCGYGRLLHYMSDKFNNQNYIGIDYVPMLIESAKEHFKNRSNVQFEIGNVFNLDEKYNKFFDITIIYKSLLCLPYYEDCIREVLKVTKNKIYLTSLFYDGDYETISKIYPSKLKDEGECVYYNTYSLPKFKKYVESLGAKVTDVIPMHLDFDIEKEDDINKLQTWTEHLKDGSRLEITGNIVLNWKLVTIEV